MKNKKNKTYIIAEVGINHNGSIVKAKKMIEIAKKSGADAVKFQLTDINLLLSKNSPLANYQKKTSNTKDQYQLIKKNLLTFDDMSKIKSYCSKKSIDFICSPFDIRSLKFLIKLNVNAIKIPSGEFSNLMLLNELKNYNKKIIISTGMSSSEEIKLIYNYLIKNLMIKKHNLILMHCNSVYPTPLSDVNLNFIKSLIKIYKCKIGYSDHTTSIIAPSLAVALGATYIEKHFTLNKRLNGPDHFMSLNPSELASMINEIRNTEKILGVDKKITSNEEILNSKLVKKAIYANRDIARGEKFDSTNIIALRPLLKGIPAIKWNKILKIKSSRNYKKGDLIIEKI